MRPFTHIIASCHREAREIAHFHGLRPGQWKYVDSVRVLEGARRLTILRTHCFKYIGPIERIDWIEEYLDRMRVLGEVESETYVRCR